MPVIDGCEATRRLRASGFTEKTLPIVTLTANAYAEDAPACRAAGMQTHLAKPVRLPELDTVLRHWTKVPDPPPRLTGADRFSPQLRERYAARRQEMLLMVDTLVRAGRFGDAEVSEVAALLHKFAGSAAIFGDGKLGAVAQQLEQGLAVWNEQERVDNVPAAAEAIKNAA